MSNADTIDKFIDRLARGVIEEGLEIGGRYAWHYIGEDMCIRLIKDALNNLALHLPSFDPKERPDNSTLRDKVHTFIEQAEWCGYECVAGRLEENIDFANLKKAIE